MYRNFIQFSESAWFVAISSKIICLSNCEIVELINSVLIQIEFNLSTWSFINEISGEIIIASHGV